MSLSSIEMIGRRSASGSRVLPPAAPTSPNLSIRHSQLAVLIPALYCQDFLRNRCVSGIRLARSSRPFSNDSSTQAAGPGNMPKSLALCASLRAGASFQAVLVTVLSAKNG